MLRSKQLLPFAKGARAWIVAGSVSKPNPLDGTANTANSEDGKSEQGCNGTKSQHSARSPVHVLSPEGSSFRGVSKGPSASAKFERIHEGSTTTFIPGPSIVRRSVVATGTVPSKNISVGSPSASAEHNSEDNSRRADLVDSALSRITPGQIIENSERVLVAKAETTGQGSVVITGKSSEVGLATLTCLSDQGPNLKHGRISNVKALDDGSSSVLPSAKGNRSCNPGAQSSEELDGSAAPLKKIIVDDKSKETSSSLNSAKPVHDTGLSASVGKRTSVSNIKKSLTSVELKEDSSVPNHEILFGTVDPHVVTSHIQPCNLEGDALFNVNSIPLKPCVGTPHQVERNVRSDAEGMKQEPNGAVNSCSQGQYICAQKGSGSSKGKEVTVGISGSGRKVNSFNQARGSRQSHWSAKGSGGEGASSEIVDQVGSILKRMGWTSQTVDALASFNVKLSAYHINEVLKHQREPGLAWEFFNWAKRQSGYKHDVRTYTTMIGILGRARNFEACDRLMKDMSREGCEPSVVTFNRLIHSYGRANYLGEALKLFHHMQDVGCEPDRVTYCTLIDLHSKAGFHDIAMDICQRMWQAGFEPDTYSYTLIIHCLGKAGNLPAAYKLFLEMIERGCTPNLVTYNTMIDLHAKAGKHHMALKLYNDMQDSGYRPDNVTYSVIMEVLGHSGHMDEAEDVFIEMEQAGWIADATAFGSLVYMWGQAGNVKKASEWYKRMLDSGLLPNVPTCNSLLWAYMRVNDYEAAKQVLDSMPKWGLLPTLPTYTLLLSSCTTRENQHDVDLTLHIMSRTGHPAHSFLCRLLNEIDSKEGTAHVHRFFDSLHDEEHDSKRSFADALIEFLYKLDHKERAGYVWEAAVQKNLYPSAINQRYPNYWIVDLHVMSMGTAVVALLRTLASLRERMLMTGVVPDRIEIVTGWGKHSKISGFSKIKNVVENILGALHAPFYVDSSNVGCFVGSGQPLVEWLHQPDMEHMLAL